MSVFARLGPVLTAGLVMAFLSAAAPGSAWGQEREIKALNQKMEKLEKDLRSVVKYLSDEPDAKRGEFQSDSGLSGQARADLEVRLSALENELRQLTGQVETALHRIDQLSKRLDRMSKDYEFRFQQLEGGGDSAGDTPSAGRQAADGETPEQAARPENASPVDESAEQSLPAGEPMAQYDKALALLRQDDYEAATQAFQSFLGQYPDHELTPNALYWLGESYYVRGDYVPAARSFLKAYDDYPKSAKASGSLLKLALSLNEIGQKKDACAALRTFSQEFPEASPIEKTRARNARKTLNCA